VSRWQPLWLLLALGLAAGVNALMKPRVEYALSAGERTLATGAVTLQDAEQSHELKLITLRVVAADVARVFAAPLVVRALWLRSPEEAGQAAPDLELFADLNPPDGSAIAADARNMTAIRARELPIVARAPGSGARSRVRFPGASAPALVSRGQLLIREALELQRGDPAQGWRIRGELTLSLSDGGNERSVTGALRAKVLW
jgi:hypothetical protein